MKLDDFLRKKNQQEKISMLTCYDYPSARMVAESNLDCVLVGDSVAMVVHGHQTTIMANMDMMALHTQAVSRGLGNQFLISDLPFLCHRASTSETIANVKRLSQAGAQAVKIEGGDQQTCETIAYIVASGIPVMGHLGLTPQSILQLGGYKVQGKDEHSATHLIQQAQRLQEAGCFALVIECVPAALVSQLTKSLRIPTIGIGAGLDTDGQVLVWHDMLGLQNELECRFVKRYASGKQILVEAINDYSNEVKHAHFPTLEHSFSD